jgi:hypothetical protein
MKHRFLMAFAIVGAIAAFAPALRAQTAAPQPAPAPGPIPKAADGHPDLSGVWWPGRDVPLRPLADQPSAPAAAGGAPRPAFPRRQSFPDLYQPSAKARAQMLGDKDDPALRCTPVAFGTLNVSLLGLGFVGQIVQTPKFVVMLTETYQSFRIVPTDGRPHRDDVAPSMRGDAIGRWEGDTLVVDISNFTDTNWMHAEGLVSFHSDALHVVERYHRVDANTLEIDATIEDPKVLTGPWKVPTQRLQLAPFDQIMEVWCTGTETASLMEAASKQNYGKK